MALWVQPTRGLKTLIGAPAVDAQADRLSRLELILKAEKTIVAVIAPLAALNSCAGQGAAADRRGSGRHVASGRGRN